MVGDDLGIEEALLGTLVSAYSLMVGLFAIISGPFSDRVGRRRILLVGTGIMTLALGAHFWVAGYWSFILVRVLAGLAGGVLSGSAVSYVGDYFAYERRGWATGWIMSGTAAGQILGIPMGVVLAGWFGFRIPFLLFGVSMAATFILVFFTLPQPEVRRSPDPVTLRRAIAGYMGLIRRPEIAAACSAFLLMFLGISFYVVYLPTWLERGIGATPNEIAILFLVGGVANVILGPQAGRISDRVGRKGIILVSCVGLAIVMALTTVVIGEVWMAYPYFFVVMALVAMRIGPFSALLTALVTSDRRGSLLSLAVAVGQVGFAVGATLSGILYASHGYAPTSTIAGLSVLGMGLMVWFLIPEPGADVAVDGIPRDAAEAATPEAPDLPATGGAGPLGGPGAPE